MEGCSRSSIKCLLLHVWCGILTVAMVAMAALLISIKPKLTEDGVSALKPDNVSSTVSSVASLKSKASSLSYIQLASKCKYTSPPGAPQNLSWEEEEPKCDSCSLVLFNNSIESKKSSIYFIYAQVTFSKHSKQYHTKSVILIRNPTFGKSLKKLFEGNFPNTTEGSVSVAKIVSLKEGDSISLHIYGDCLLEGTFWGAYQLH
ncbi:uncharacterized protein LOC121906310 [Thunnus maccoyii]|uniref:uncharacterized protein LOC121906310 n=1 Tax=Thunnus maccoyii TaxID=8240 RepID=UPI001C4C67C8|nr:uncharacterized protein LOC121906310 [Thunnus maccoyii]